MYFAGKLVYLIVLPSNQLAISRVLGKYGLCYTIMGQITSHNLI